MIGSILRAAAVILVAPLITGMIKKCKALLQGRYGPPIWQPYLDLLKLFGKQPVMSKHSSWLSQAGPMIYAGAIFYAAALVPWSGSGYGGLHAGKALLGTYSGDLILVISLFALGRFLIALVGLDAASAFGGMGSSREMLISALAEPAALLALFTVAIPAGSTNLGRVAHFAMQEGWGDFALPRLLALIAFAIVILAETGRIPVDNPDTHLELTMVHEGMVLDLSGRHLAWVQWGTSVKQLLLFVLLTTAFLSGPFEGVAAVAFRLGEVVLIVLAIALIESTLAKMRLFKVPGLLGAAFLLALFAMVAQLATGG
ncbi:MAG TPA: formate hydrogenlyase [Firmicutes bacterium]|jgi:formate hydrogenlyase subunit 4|nr:formate hydrogenlyase [Bacillota bacterium]HAZ22003.1 formate hydrogenlyase [Bacillota bacterium]HCF89547.1 formate hydrogenlyase [Bacillota bacterium]HCX71239.1 formate hydrogenlyase [Bacillota bacterium]